MSSSVFPVPFSGIQEGLLAAKGDLISASANDTPGILTAPSTNNYVLTSDSSQTLGIKWAAVAAGGGETLIETLSLSGSSVTSSTIAGTYKHLFVVVKDVYLSGNDNMTIRLNSDTASNYYGQALEIDNTSVSGKNETTNAFFIVDLGNNSAAIYNGYGTIFIPRYTDTSSVVQIQSIFTGYIAGNKRSKINWGFYDNSAAITSITLRSGTATFSAGTAYIYGVS
jgi:hypothetical protein